MLGLLSSPNLDGIRNVYTVLSVLIILLKQIDTNINLRIFNRCKNDLWYVKSQQHPKGFPGGPPPQYWPGLSPLDFRVRMGSGVFDEVWPLAKTNGHASTTPNPIKTQTFFVPLLVLFLMKKYFFWRDYKKIVRFQKYLRFFLFRHLFLRPQTVATPLNGIKNFINVESLFFHPKNN